MSHIHLPDGTLPLFWWLSGYAVTALLLFLAMRNLQGEQARRKLPFIGAIGALMLLTMSVPLGPLPLHLNLTVLIGIIAGPSLSLLTIFVVNILLALLGHGGITTVGVNTLILSCEAALGWYLFHRLFQQRRLAWRTMLAAALSLLLSITLSISLVGASTGLWTAALPHSHHEELEEHAPVTQHEHGHHDHEHTHELAQATFGEAVNSFNLWGMVGLGGLVLVLLLGLLIEALATWGIVGYLSRVRPDLLQLSLVE